MKVKKPLKLKAFWDALTLYNMVGLLFKSRLAHHKKPCNFNSYRVFALFKSIVEMKNNAIPNKTGCFRKTDPEFCAVEDLSSAKVCVYITFARLTTRPASATILR